MSISKRFLRAGAKLSICDVVQANLDSAAEKLGLESNRVLTTVCDVRNISEVRKWIEKTIEKFGKLDGAANMAGIIGAKPGPYVEEHSRSIYCQLGARIAFVGIDARNDRRYPLCDDPAAREHSLRLQT